MDCLFSEAVHFGKPVVGIPFFFDQYLNMYLAQQKGFGISVPIETLNADNIASAVTNVLLTPRLYNYFQTKQSHTSDGFCFLCQFLATRSKQN